jgi:peptide/nickel transport system substrate-binding protein
MKAKTLTVACVLALGAAACSGGSAVGDRQGNGEYVTGGTFTTPLGSDPGNLNPLQAVQISTNAVVPFLYDTLINIDESGKVVSQLAEKWETTPTSATFTLRKDVTCSDGTTLTATHVAANYAYIKNPKNNSSAIGDKLPSADFTVKADDAAGTVTITVPQPYGFLLVGSGTVPIVCPKGLADPKLLARGADGTGPYTLTENVPDDHLTFAVRQDYKWGPGGATTAEPGIPAKVVVKIVQNETTAANLMLAGQLTETGAAGADRKRLEGRGYHTSTTLSGPTELWFNQRSGRPGSDPAVRRALTTALDLDQLTKVLTQGNGVRATSLTVLEPRPCRAETVPGALPGHDLAAARTALDQAGWTAGGDGVRAKGGQRLALTLIYPTGETATDAGMELLRQQLRDLGVDVRLKGSSTNAFTETLFQGTGWDAAFLVVSVAYPTSFMPFVTGVPSPEGQNFAAVSNADYTRLATEALRTPGDPGCELWAQAEQALFRDVDVVPVANDRAITFVNKARYSQGLLGHEPTTIRLLAG